MRNKIPLHLTMRVATTLVVMVELGVISVVAYGVTALLQYFHITVNVPSVVWLALISVVLGGAVTAVLGRWLFDPVKKLGKAMRQVAQGNFDVRLKTTSRFREIRDINANFNLMVQELGNTDTLQTDFVSNVSHEFKTPINAIEGYAMLLQSGENLNLEEQSGYVDKILLNTRRLSNLVGNILLLSKVDNQAIAAKKNTFRLDEQIRHALLLLEAEWEKKEIELDVELEPVEYTGNEGMLLHVWSNLIGNAIKFDPQGGYLGLRLSKQEAKIIFSVSDNGPGIPEEAQKHIFARFYQTDSSRREEGNGLGLALVKQILETCNGCVTVENRPEGGCRFTVVLDA